MKEVRGDLIQLAKDGEFDVIVHGCNCLGNMGAGIALQIAKAFPIAAKVDKEVGGDVGKLGKISVAQVPATTEHGTLYIVNAYTQAWYGKANSEREQEERYHAISKAMYTVAAKFGKLRIGIPCIGAGLAGGDWTRIKSIIDEAFKGIDITIVEYKR